MCVCVCVCVCTLIQLYVQQDWNNPSNDLNIAKNLKQIINNYLNYRSNLHNI